MRASRPLPDLLCPTQRELEWFPKSGVCHHMKPCMSECLVLPESWRRAP